MEANRPAFVITLSREFRSTGTTACSNGSTAAVGFLRNTAAATSAATSTQRTVVVEPARWPVMGLDMEPETSGQTTTSPAIGGTFAIASSSASCKAFRTSGGTAASQFLCAVSSWYGN